MKKSHRQTEKRVRNWRRALEKKVPGEGGGGGGGEQDIIKRRTEQIRTPAGEIGGPCSCLVKQQGA